MRNVELLEQLWVTSEPHELSSMRLDLTDCFFNLPAFAISQERSADTSFHRLTTFPGGNHLVHFSFWKCVSRAISESDWGHASVKINGCWICRAISRRDAVVAMISALLGCPTAPSFGQRICPWAGSGSGRGCEPPTSNLIL